MRIFRLAEILAAKHKIAASAIDLEASLRRKIPVLWNYPNKSFDILKACADSGITNAKTPDERKAYSGYKFCKDLLSAIDYIHANWTNISLQELEEGLKYIVNLINQNKDIKFGETGRPSKDAPSPLISLQFPHVSALIHEIFPISKKHDKKLRGELQGKARTGLSRILSFSLSLLEDLNKIKEVSPEKFEPSEAVDQVPNRFSPQRAGLSDYDVIDFIRQHGSDYGISSTDDWGKVFMNDPVLKEEMTTVINALNRGHYPNGAVDVKREIADILTRHKERLAKSNAHLFEDTEL